MSRFLLEVIIFVNNTGTDMNEYETVIGGQVKRGKSGARLNKIYVSLLFFQHYTQV